MGEDPSNIRAELEQTRARVGDEVDAISYKTDVGARMGDYVDDKKQAVKSKFTGASDAHAQYRREQPTRARARRSRGWLRRRNTAAADPCRK
jgi:hypothetical protein